MLYSKLLGKTKKTIADYSSVNAKLLQQAGFVNQTMSGVYSYLLLGHRVLNKIEDIIREEMNTIGQEVLMPSLSPKSLWEKTGRIKKIDALFKVNGANDLSLKKNNAEYILNPTHEEVLMPIAKEYFGSYKDFPFAIYQIQWKFRNEPRAKSGLLRGREFRMKDLYSFHTSEEDFKKYYENSKKVYLKVFERLGLGSDTVICMASGGVFTSDFSHEFQTICETGEDTIFFVKSKNLYYNREVAPSKAPPVKYNDDKVLPRKDVEGKGIIGVEELADFLKIPLDKTTKTLLFETERGDVIAAAVRGGYDINEEKLIKIVGCKTLKLASVEKVKKVTGAEVGYAGLLNLPKAIQIFMDESMDNRINFEMGANKTNFHSINVNFGEDLPKPERFYDFKTAKVGDLYPLTGEKYKVMKSAEVGNIFPLGTRFADDFQYYYLDQKGKQNKIYMGCYGIGPSRIMGVLVEKFHDERGILWPESVAPYKYHLLGLDLKDETVKKRVYEIYNLLTKTHNLEVLFDDREDVMAGEKFADADLIGIPYRLVVSKRTGDKIELKKRNERASKLVLLSDIK